MTNFVSNDDFANVTRLVECPECGRLDEPEAMAIDLMCGTCTDMLAKEAAFEQLHEQFWESTKHRIVRL